MKNLYRQFFPPDQKIKEIIIALETYALGDIKYNIYGPDQWKEKCNGLFEEHKPIAAFILCSCLIDQAAAFAYNPKLGENECSYKRFIREFMPVYYQPINLYTNLRNLLVHGYSVGEYLSIMLEKVLTPIDEKNISAFHISANRLYEDLKEAIEKLKPQLLSDTEIRKNALARYDEFPPLTEGGNKTLIYTRKAADYLITLYKQQLTGKFMNENPALPIVNVTKIQHNPPGNWYHVLGVARYAGHKHTLPLHALTNQFGLMHPTEALKIEGLSKEYTLLDYQNPT